LFQINQSAVNRSFRDHHIRQKAFGVDFVSRRNRVYALYL
jgi:hypothetical protein